MDPGSSDTSDGPKPKRLKTSALGVKFSGGNTLLHQFVLQNSDPNESGSENYINAVLLSMSDAAADVVNALNNDGYSALGLAVSKNNCMMVKKLLTCLVHVNVNATCCRDDGHTAFHIAAELGHLTIICELLNKGAGIDIMNRFDETALCVAARSRHLDIVKFLVNESANVNVICVWGTPLSYAVKLGNSAIVEFLVSSGADISADGWRALREAAGSGNLDILKLLLERAVNFDIKSGSGCKVFLSAVESGNLATVEFLVSKGADVNAENEYGDTPLYVAAYYGSSIAIVQFLINQGADLDAGNGASGTLLHFAAARENADFAELLIGKGADLHAKNRNGQTPLHCAVMFGKIECAVFLIDQGADLHTTDVMGWTPLHTAADDGHEAMIRLLLDKGADVKAKNKDDKTPLDLARENGKQSCMDALQNIRQ